MDSELGLYQERRLFYRRVVIGGALFGAHVLVILALLALFFT